MFLTKRQRQIYDYIKDFIEEQGYAPSIVEIGENFNLTSPATVHKHLQNLSQKGMIKRSWNKSRAIELMPETLAVENILPEERITELPLRGVIPAGGRLEAIEETETIPLPWATEKNNLYVLKVKGNSMIEDHIQDEDYVIVEQRQSAQNGETVVALVDNLSATLKRLYYESNGWVRLQPSNSAMEPIMIEEDRLRIQGVVVGVLRRY